MSATRRGRLGVVHTNGSTGKRREYQRNRLIELEIAERGEIEERRAEKEHRASDLQARTPARLLRQFQQLDQWGELERQENGRELGPMLDQMRASPPFSTRPGNYEFLPSGRRKCESYQGLTLRGRL